MSERRQTQKAVRECAEAMAYMLTIGWTKGDLDKLEEIWWSIRDDNGRIIHKSEARR